MFAGELMRTVNVVAARGEGGAGAAGSSRGAAAASRPHGKEDVAPRNPAAKHAVYPTSGEKSPAKKRQRDPQPAPERRPAPVISE